MSGAALRLAVVVVTFERLEKLRVTVERLLAEPCDHLLVVDNGSGDGSRAWLEGLKDPRLELLFADSNLGGAGGFEAGLRRARTLWQADWYLVMDDDARPRPGCLAAFRAMDRSGWEALAGAVTYPGADPDQAGAICEMNRPSRDPFASLSRLWATARQGRAGFHIPDAAYAGETVTRIDVASFVGLFLSDRALDRVGYPDGALFIYADDSLYTLGLSRAGGRIGFAPQLGFEHDCATLTPGDRARLAPLWKVYYHHRNLLLLYRRTAGALFWAVLPLVLLRWWRDAKSYESDREAYLRLYRAALRDGLTNHRNRTHSEIRALSAIHPPFR